MPARLQLRLTCAALLLIAFAKPLDADVIHLTNGGSIEADSWEESGEDLIIRQDGATIVIPRDTVSRIEAKPRRGRSATGEGAEQTSPGGGSATAPASSTALPATAPSREEALERLVDLKRRVRDYPMARAANTTPPYVWIGRFNPVKLLTPKSKGTMARA